MDTTFDDDEDAIDTTGDDPETPLADTDTTHDDTIDWHRFWLDADG